MPKNAARATIDCADIHGYNIIAGADINVHTKREEVFKWKQSGRNGAALFSG